MTINNQTQYLLAIFVGALTPLIALNLGSSVDDVNASTNPNYLVGNLSLSNNLTTSQVLEISDKITNYTKYFVQESNGNLTKMNILLIDDLENRSIINEKDKQELLSLNIALNEFNPLGNLTLLDRDVSSLLDETVTNSSNPMLVTLKSDLNKKIHDIGTNVGTLISGNGTHNVTDGLTGLPPSTIGDFWDDEHRSLRLTLGCQALGTVVSGVALGSYIGSICGVILV